MKEEKEGSIVERHQKSNPDFHEKSIEQYPEPTAEDWKNLPEVSDSIPKAAFLVILIEFCERFTYYGLSGPFQNYIQNPAPASCKSCTLQSILPV
jgi:POT family proton-dependent oligopeptide transporter